MADNSNNPKNKQQDTQRERDTERHKEQQHYYLHYQQHPLSLLPPPLPQQQQQQQQQQQSVQQEYHPASFNVPLLNTHADESSFFPPFLFDSSSSPVHHHHLSSSHPSSSSSPPAAGSTASSPFYSPSSFLRQTAMGASPSSATAHTHPLTQRETTAFLFSPSHSHSVLSLAHTFEEDEFNTGVSSISKVESPDPSTHSTERGVLPTQTLTSTTVKTENPLFPSSAEQSLPLSRSSPVVSVAPVQSLQSSFQGLEQDLSLSKHPPVIPPPSGVFHPGFEPRASFSTGSLFPQQAELQATQQTVSSSHREPTYIPTMMQPSTFLHTVPVAPQQRYHQHEQAATAGRAATGATAFTAAQVQSLFSLLHGQQPFLPQQPPLQKTLSTPSRQRSLELNLTDQASSAASHSSSSSSSVYSASPPMLPGILPRMPDRASSAEPAFPYPPQFRWNINQSYPNLTQEHIQQTLMQSHAQYLQQLAPASVSSSPSSAVRPLASLPVRPPSRERSNTRLAGLLLHQPSPPIHLMHRLSQASPYAAFTRNILRRRSFTHEQEEQERGETEEEQQTRFQWQQQQQQGTMTPQQYYAPAPSPAMDRPPHPIPTQSQAEQQLLFYRMTAPQTIYSTLPPRRTDEQSAPATQPAVPLSASTAPEAHPVFAPGSMDSPLLATSVAPASSSSSASSSSADVLVSHVPKRRRSSPPLPHETWSCPYNCGKVYRRSSTRSIAKHQQICDNRELYQNLFAASRAAGLTFPTRRKQSRRRQSSELADHERWNCPRGCGRFFRSTSTRSIHRHKRMCRYPFSSTEEQAKKDEDDDEEGDEDDDDNDDKPDQQRGHDQPREGGEEEEEEEEDDDAAATGQTKHTTTHTSHRTITQRERERTHHPQNEQLSPCLPLSSSPALSAVLADLNLHPMKHLLLHDTEEEKAETQRRDKQIPINGHTKPQHQQQLSPSYINNNSWRNSHSRLLTILQKEKNTRNKEQHHLIHSNQ